MDYIQKGVTEFHEMIDNIYPTIPTKPSVDIITRRMNLMIEELQELESALSARNLIEIADGIADLIYVVYGTAVECGIDIEDINKEVHRSNMTKLGGHKNEYGKWIKPDTYELSNIKPIIEKQLNGV